MLKGLGDNPIMQRLVRGRRGPSLRNSIRITLALLVSSFATGLYSFVMDRGRWTPFHTFMFDVAWATTLLLPLVIMVTAAIQTARDGRSQLGQLVRISPLPNTTHLQGYLFSTLHQLRLLLAAYVGLSPFLITGMMQTHIRYRFATICYPGSSCNVNAVMTPAHVAGPLIAFAGVVIAVMGINWLGAVLGVGLALWARRATEIAVGLVALVYSLGVGLLVAMMFRDAAALPYDSIPTVLAFVAPAWIPYALAPTAARLVVRQFAMTPVLA